MKVAIEAPAALIEISAGSGGGGSRQNGEAACGRRPKWKIRVKLFFRQGKLELNYVGRYPVGSMDMDQRAVSYSTEFYDLLGHQGRIQPNQRRPSTLQFASTGC
jgi:hypothetical protein